MSLLIPRSREAVGSELGKTGYPQTRSLAARKYHTFIALRFTSNRNGGTSDAYLEIQEAIVPQMTLSA